jgi:hypothetical protein
MVKHIGRMGEIIQQSMAMISVPRYRFVALRLPDRGVWEAQIES